MPTKNSDVFPMRKYYNAALDAYENVQGENGASFSQLTGCKVSAPLELFSNLLIRDTASKYSAPVASSGLPYKRFILANTLDQSIEVVCEISKDGVTFEYVATLASSHGANTTAVYGVGSHPVLRAPFPYWRIRAKALVSPLSGSVNAWGIQHAN